MRNGNPVAAFRALSARCAKGFGDRWIEFDNVKKGILLG
jgi:hypothetical protein